MVLRDNRVRQIGAAVETVTSGSAADQPGPQLERDASQAGFDRTVPFRSARQTGRSHTPGSSVSSPVTDTHPRLLVVAELSGRQRIHRSDRGNRSTRRPSRRLAVHQFPLAVHRFPSRDAASRNAPACCGDAPTVGDAASRRDAGLPYRQAGLSRAPAAESSSSSARRLGGSRTGARRTSPRRDSVSAVAYSHAAPTCEAVTALSPPPRL